MKKVLLGTTALFGVGLLASPAFAADGIKLSVGGFFKSAYLVNFDDDKEGRPGNDHNVDGFFSDAEVHFTGETTLDNGLTVGARIELEGESEGRNSKSHTHELVRDDAGNITGVEEADDGGRSGDQIDEAYVYWSGGFGEVRVGSDDEALAAACILPPGGTSNFSAFSPNQWGANSLTSNTACTGVDDKGDAQKIVYITPNFSGFQLTLSYTPDGDAETHGDGAGAHLGMTGHEDGSSRHNFSAYATYSYEGDDWGVTVGGGGSWEGHVEEQAHQARPEQDFYQTGLVVTFGSFAIGGALEIFNDVDDTIDDGWVAGGGMSYTMDAWTVGVQGSHLYWDIDNSSPFDGFTQDRIALTGDYAMGPGINIDAEVAYTWSDTNANGANEYDNYDAVEIGIGSTLKF